MNHPVPLPDDRHALPAALIHDLRTPLSHIIGYTELLVEQAQEAGQEAFIPFLLKVRAAGYRLVGMIDDNFHSVAVLSDAAAIVGRELPMPAEVLGGAPPGARAAEPEAHEPGASDG